MYIRRKVFSKLTNEYGEERYFSTTEYTYMTEAEQREFVSKAEKEAKMQLAREIADAEEAGDTKRAKELKKRFTKKDRKLGATIGYLGGGVGAITAGGMLGAAAGTVRGLKKDGFDLDKLDNMDYNDPSLKNTKKGALRGAGIGALAGLGVKIGSQAIGRKVGKNISEKRYQKYKKAVEEEREEERKNKKNKKD